MLCRLQVVPMSLHIKLLEVPTGWKVIQHFALLLWDYHILIRRDNKTAAVHINCQEE